MGHPTIIRRTGAQFALLGLLAGTSVAAGASLAYGTLSNFDVYNDSTDTYYGFEIELEDVHRSSVIHTYPNLYHTSVSEAVDGVSGRVTSTVRYAAQYINGAFDHGTVPHTSADVATNGHTCISVVGCEHFGVAYYNNATATRYRWLAADPATPGSLIAGPIVSLGAPNWSVLANPNPADPPIVRADVDAPEFEAPEPGERKADAVWVKVFKTEVEEPAALEDLASGEPVIEQAETETEWELLEKGRQLNKEAEAGEGAKQVIRRYEFYRYTGAVDDENEPLCIFDGCGEPNLDPLAGPIELGALIGAQMAAVNLEAVELPDAVPVPAALPLLLSGLAAAAGLGRRRSQQA